MDALEELAGSLRERLLREAGSAEAPGEGDLHARIGALVERECGLLDPDARAQLVAMVAERSFGLGPLEPLLGDPAVDEVMVNGPGAVWVERAGRVERAAVAFGRRPSCVTPSSGSWRRWGAGWTRRAARGRAAARRLAGQRRDPAAGPRGTDPDHPAISPPRIQRRRAHRGGTLNPPLRDFLARCVRARLNLLVSGGTGSGKTTTLNALSAFIPEGERIVTIEDAAELRLRQPHVVRLESRPANLEGRGEVTIRGLVRNALRMRPDRIVVGEVRGAEALDMLAAMTTGHDGSLSTVHAGSPEEAVRRVETLALMADVALPHAAIREQVADAIDVVVHQARMRDGARRVMAVAEVVRVAGAVGVREVYALRDGRPRWRAALSDGAAARLAAAAERVCR